MLKGFAVWALILPLMSALEAAPIISEFMASNDSTLADEDGDFPDWIEIYNPDSDPVDLAGYFLTDDSTDLTKWSFPSSELAPGAYLVVFASDKNRTDPRETLHANFKLSASGDYLALVGPGEGGTEVIADFGETFPPQFEDQSFGVGAFGIGYFDEPTPGDENDDGEAIGPRFLGFTKSLPRPSPSTLVTVATELEGAVAVDVIYRVDTREEVRVGAQSEDDRFFSAEIPTGEAGQLLRWRFEATDALGNSTREPAFRDPEDSDEFYGTVVRDPSIRSLAPVVEWFITPFQFSKILSFQSGRGGIYYLGEYYDNIEFTLHGQSSLFFPKKSFNIDFNKTHRFKWREGEIRVKDVDLLTNWADKSKVRNTLAYQVMREAGVPTHFAFQVRVQQNGEFFSVTDMVEDGDDRYLERAGLNPEGALYKAVDSRLGPEDIGVTESMRKRTRKDEDHRDLDDFIRGINQEGAEQRDFIYDHVDLPMTLNTLAALVIIMQTDMATKNYYLYRDTGESNEWAILPWDVDLTFGRNFTRTKGYYDQRLYFSGYTEHEETADIVTLVNYLIDENLDTREMFFARLRTLVDQFYLSDFLFTILDEQVSLLDPVSISPSDALLDLQEWGTWLDGFPTPRPWDFPSPDAESMREAVDRIKFEWSPLRRFELLIQAIDLPEPVTDPSIMFGIVDYDPVSEDQDEEFFELLNQGTEAVDLSGWTVTGGVRMTIPPGTVLLPGDSLFCSRRKASFRGRDVSPRGQEQRFVVGPYSGGLSRNGETLNLFDRDGILHDSLTFSGDRKGFNGNATKDLDGDGLGARFEYAMGLSDREFSSSPVVSGDLFLHSERIGQSEGELVVEVSQDLVTWTAIEGEEISRVASTAEREIVTIKLPEFEGKVFARLSLLPGAGE